MNGACNCLHSLLAFLGSNSIYNVVNGLVLLLANLGQVLTATLKWPLVEITASVFFFSTVGQGEWGMTEWDEEEERRRSVKFIDNVIPDTRAQLRVLSKSYQVGCEYIDN